MFLKLIMFFLILWLIAMLAIWGIGLQIKRWFKSIKGSQQTNSSSGTTETTSKLVQCNHCGLYLPIDQALELENCYYCNQQCLAQRDN